MIQERTAWERLQEQVRVVFRTGVAPGANLFGVKVFNSEGYGNVSDLMGGFQWSVERGAHVISYSGGAFTFDTLLCTNLS